MFPYLSLVLGGRLANKLRVIDESILGCVPLGLECPEQSLLRTQDLNRGSRLLGQVEQGTCDERNIIQYNRNNTIR